MRLQNVRRYATEAPKSGGSGTALIGVLGLAAAAGGFYFYNQGGAAAVPKPPAKVAFTGGDQGFLSLKLAEVVILNHNTKKLRFELPESDQESGLHVACEWLD